MTVHLTAASNRSTSRPTAHRTDRPRVPTARLGPDLLATAVAALYSALSLTQYRRLATPSWDLAIFTQAVDSWAHGHLPVIDAKGLGTAQLGDHFSPILALLAPVYRVFPSPATLLVAQAVLVAVSVIPVLRLATSHLGTVDGYAVAVAYALSWGLQNAVAADFHEVAFAVPILAVVACRLVERRFDAVAVWSLPLLLVKEDLGLTVMVVGMLVLRTRRRLGFAMVVTGLVTVVLVTSVVMPWFAHGERYGYSGQLELLHGAPTPSHLLTSALDLFRPWAKVQTLLWLLLPVGVLAVRSPVMLLAVPTLLWRFGSDNTAYWGTNWHYSAVLMPIVFIAAIDAAGRARRSLRPWWRAWGGRLPTAADAASLALCLVLPLDRFGSVTTWQHAPHADAIRRAVATVPDGAWVEGNLTVLAPLAGRTRVSFVGRTPVDAPVAPTWIVLDLQSWRPAPDARLADWATSAHPGHTYVVQFVEDEVAVLRETT